MLTRLFIGFLHVFSRLPYRAQTSVGNGLGRLLFAAVAPRRRVTLRNLELCFPDWTPAQRVAAARAHFKAWARAFLDRGLLWFAPRERLESLIHIEGLEHLDAALPSNTGQPLIIVVPHFVGLDAAGVAFSLHHKAVSMYSEQKNQLLDDLLRAGRSRFNASELYSRSDGIRPVVRAMKKGTPYFVLPDMDLGAADAVFVDFFGVKTATVTVVPKLARMANARVIGLVATFAADGKGYVARYYPSWPGSEDADETAATRAMNAFIEERVREAPEQYYWVHKRFKTRPAGEASLY
jgi:KDO2-lipid IV(A) lauroyltransferase